jgi:hypothetical protein
VDIEVRSGLCRGIGEIGQVRRVAGIRDRLGSCIDEKSGSLDRPRLCVNALREEIGYGNQLRVVTVTEITTFGLSETHGRTSEFYTVSLQRFAMFIMKSINYLTDTMKPVFSLSPCVCVSRSQPLVFPSGVPGFSIIVSIHKASVADRNSITSGGV